jgi:hypothetical protein
MLTAMSASLPSAPAPGSTLVIKYTDFAQCARLRRTIHRSHAGARANA